MRKKRTFKCNQCLCNCTVEAVMDEKELVYICPVIDYPSEMANFVEVTK